MTIAIDTLRLEDPSTLFETHALGTLKRGKLLKPNRTHIVLAVGGKVDQIRVRLYCELSTYGRLGRSR